MAGIFISYRREDSSPYAGRIYDKLVERFPRATVFMDIGTLEPGQDFVEAIEGGVQSCQVLLAIIGKAWLSVQNPQGERRLDNPKDWVRVEIQTALDRNIRVIPCLVGGAGMPRGGELPSGMHKLARRNAWELRDRRFHDDMDVLVKTISRCLSKQPGPSGAAKSKTSARLTRRSKVAAPEGMILLPQTYMRYQSKKKNVVKLKQPIFLDVHPVTNEAFVKFVAAKGYTQEKYWSEDGWKWRKRHQATHPAFWKSKKWNQPGYPVVGVSFYEAEAYARWAGKRIPTETEWECAAMGAEGRLYPWGNTFEGQQCNAKESGFKRTTPVTQFNEHRSPNGFVDLAGNVWEWCESWWNRDKAMRVLRGGSWMEEGRFLRSTYRNRSWPSSRKKNIGFRCAKDVF